jgi:hypothetical protein
MPPCVRVGGVLTGAEDDIPPHRKRPSPHPPGCLRGIAAGVNPHIAKAVLQPRLEETARRLGQRLAPTAQRPNLRSHRRPRLGRLATSLLRLDRLFFLLLFWLNLPLHPRHNLTSERLRLDRFLLFLLRFLLLPLHLHAIRQLGPNRFFFLLLLLLLWLDLPLHPGHNSTSERLRLDGFLLFLLRFFLLALHQRCALAAHWLCLERLFFFLSGLGLTLQARIWHAHDQIRHSIGFPFVSVVRLPNSQRLTLGELGLGQGRL